MCIPRLIQKLRIIVPEVQSFGKARREESGDDAKSRLWQPLQLGMGIGIPSIYSGGFSHFGVILKLAVGSDFKGIYCQSLD